MRTFLQAIRLNNNLSNLKRMNFSLPTLLLAGLLPVTVTFSNAQTSHDPNHGKLKEQTQKVQEHALKIKYGESRTQREHKQNAEEIQKHLDSASLSHQELKKNIRRKHRDETEPNNLAIEKHQLEAKKHMEAMNNELAKDKHNELKIRHHANHINASMEKAEKERERLEETTSKQ